MIDEKKKYYSDIISTEQIDKWYKNRDIVCLNGGMGAGKSQFVFDKVLKRALQRDDVEQIIILSNRAKLKEQLQKRYNLSIASYEELLYWGDKRGFMLITTYQAFDMFTQSVQDMKDSVKWKWIETDKTIIICDEFHYFLGDSWNGTTSNCLDKVMLYNCNTYLLSATATETLKYIKTKYRRDIEVIPLQTDYSHIILKSYSELTARNTATAQQIIEEVLNTSDTAKVLYFRNNKGLIETMQTNILLSYGDVVQVCKSGDNTATDNNHKLLKRVTLTTSTLDNGIDIIDDDLQVIIIDLIDLYSVIQAIGRKRTTTPTTIYICERSIQQLNGFRDLINHDTRQLTHTERYYNILRLSWLNQYKQSGVVATVYKNLKTSGIKWQRAIDLKSFKDYLRRCRTKHIEVDMLKLKKHFSHFGIDITEKTYVNTLNNHLISLEIDEKFTQNKAKNGKNRLFLSELF